MKLLTISASPLITNAKYFPSPKELESFLEGSYYDSLLFVIWHWKVPDWMLNQYRCIGMHTGPLLEGRGRGGSPIPNLRLLNIPYATVCSFDMTDVYDHGKIHTAQPISLAGEVEDIYKRIDELVPNTVAYLNQNPDQIPEKFYRLRP